MKFDKLVEKLIKESIGDPDAEAAAVRDANRARDERIANVNPQASYSRDSFVRDANRVHGLKVNPLGVIMVQWKGSKDAKPLRHPVTKEVLTYRYNKSKEKVKALEDSGKYDRVWFRQTEID